MGIIIRIDVDRPYGRRPILRHCLSRLSSDFYFPRISGFGYLAELRTLLNWLNDARARAYVFFRRCTLPSKSILELLEVGRHQIGLHLENSRTFATFLAEKRILEHHVGKRYLLYPSTAPEAQNLDFIIMPRTNQKDMSSGLNGFHALVSWQSGRPVA